MKSFEELIEMIGHCVTRKGDYEAIMKQFGIVVDDMAVQMFSRDPLEIVEAWEEILGKEN